MEGENKQILIVDDDVFLLDMYALKFSQTTFEVFACPSAACALEKLRGGLNPTILLTDLIMPEMDGFQMLEIIKKENLCSKSAIVILSNKGQESDVVQGKALGACGFIVKANSTPAEVIKQVMEFLDKKNNSK